jgi:PAS domain S-box-containing protein
LTKASPSSGEPSDASQGAAEELYRAVFNSIDQGFCTIEVAFDEGDNPVDYRFLVVSPSFERQTGIRNGAGRWMREIAPDQDQHWFDTYGRVALTGEPARFENYSTPLGRWWEVYAFRIRGPRRIGVIFHDITVQKRAEAALRESEERFRRFAEASPNTLWIADAGTEQLEYLSPAFEPVWGRPRGIAPLSLAVLTQAVHPNDRLRTDERFAVLKAGAPLELDYRIIRPDGTERHIHETAFPIMENGRIRQLAGIAQDLTDATNHRKQLEENEERLRTAMEVGRLGLWDWDIRTDEVHWSDEHFLMEGYAVGGVTPSYEAWSRRIHPEDRGPTETALQEAMTTRCEFAREFRVVHPDGTVHWLSGRGRFTYDEEGRPLRMVGAMVETTERKVWEEQQKVLVTELQHRTRNLVAVVRSLSRRSLEEAASLEDFQERFELRLSALAGVQGLLSHLSAGERVSFDHLLRSQLEALGALDAARVTLDGPRDVLLRSGAVQIFALALYELATNAIKYGALSVETGRLDVSWRLERKAGALTLHVLWIESGAPGSTENEVRTGGYGRQLIERALPYQLDAETTYVLEPTGLRCTISAPVEEPAGPP